MIFPKLRFFALFHTTVSSTRVFLSAKEQYHYRRKRPPLCGSMEDLAAGLYRDAPEIQFIANHGYAIYAVNNRRSSGYGRASSKRQIHKHGEADLDDCVEAARYLGTLDSIDEENRHKWKGATEVLWCSQLWPLNEGVQSN